MIDPDATCPGCHSGDFADFDHYCDAKQIQPAEAPAAFGAWLNATSGWDGPQAQVEAAPPGDAAALPGLGTTTVRIGTSARVAARQTLCPHGVHDYRRIDGVRTCRLCGDTPPSLDGDDAPAAA